MSTTLKNILSLPLVSLLLFSGCSTTPSNESVGVERQYQNPDAASRAISNDVALTETGAEPASKDNPYPATLPTDTSERDPFVTAAIGPDSVICKTINDYKIVVRDGEAVSCDTALTLSKQYLEYLNALSPYEVYNSEFNTTVDSEHWRCMADYAPGEQVGPQCDNWPDNHRGDEHVWLAEMTWADKCAIPNGWLVQGDYTSHRGYKDHIDGEINCGVALRFIDFLNNQPSLIKEGWGAKDGFEELFNPDDYEHGEYRDGYWLCNSTGYCGTANYSFLSSFHVSHFPKDTSVNATEQNTTVNDNHTNAVPKTNKLPEAGMGCSWVEAINSFDGLQIRAKQSTNSAPITTVPVGTKFIYEDCIGKGAVRASYENDLGWTDNNDKIVSITADSDLPHVEKR